MLEPSQVNIVASNLQVTRCFVVALGLLTPPERLPGCGGTKGCKNIDPATPPVITPEHTGGSTPVLVPVLVTCATGAALAKSR